MKDLIFLLLAMPLTLAAQKTIYIPNEWQGGSFDYSLERSAESDNFIIFWGPLAGADPTQAPTAIAFNPQDILNKAEDLYRFYIDTIDFVDDDNGGLITQYKIILVMLHTWPNLEGWAFGGNYDGQVGAMWMHPHAASSGPTLAHEFAHTLQNYTWMMNPGHGFIDSSYVGFFWETHAEFMALQKYPSVAREFDMARWLNTAHFHWSSTRHHYQAFMFLQFIKEKDGIAMINRMWNESIIGEHPLQTYMRLKGIDQDALNHLFMEYAMRNVTWDYEIQEDLRMRMETLPRQFVAHETIIPELIHTSGQWYAVADHLAPQDYGYNIIRLHPQYPADCEAQFVYVDLKESAVYPGDNELGILFALVAVDENGNARYSDAYDPSEIMFEVMENETALYLVVLAAPNVQHNYAYEIGFPKIHRQPYTFRLKNAKPEGFQPGFNSPPVGVAGAPHSNGGGFVAATATVSSEAYIGPNALVLDNAQVLEAAVIDGYAVVKENAVVRGNARINHYAVIGEDAQVSGNAHVSEHAHVFGGSSVFDAAMIKGNSLIFFTQVFENATLDDNTFCWGANLHGDVRLGGDAEFFSECAEGTYMQVDFAYNRFCDGLDDHPANEDLQLISYQSTDPGAFSLVCDTLLHSRFGIEDFVICEGDSVVYNGVVYTESTAENIYYEAVSGVDSIVILWIDVFLPTHAYLVGDGCKGDTTWVLGFPVVPGVLYDEVLVADSAGCGFYLSGMLDVLEVDTTIIVADNTLEVEEPALFVEWYDCETNQSTGIFGKTFDPPTDGFYKARILSLDTCEAYSGCHFVLGTATSNPGKPAWNLYPNPASDVLTISIADIAISGFEVQMTNAIGQEIRLPDKRIYATGSIDIAHLPLGTYSLQLTAKDGTTSIKRFVKTD